MGGLHSIAVAAVSMESRLQSYFHRHSSLLQFAAAAADATTICVPGVPRTRWNHACTTLLKKCLRVLRRARSVASCSPRGRFAFHHKSASEGKVCRGVFPDSSNGTGVFDEDSLARDFVQQISSETAKNVRAHCLRLFPDNGLYRHRDLSCQVKSTHANALSGRIFSARFRNRILGKR